MFKTLANRVSQLRHITGGVAGLSRNSFSSNESRLKVKTFNKISPVGLDLLPRDLYDVSADHSDSAQAIILRSQKLTEEDIPLPVRCLARCGAGTNNCQVELMTQRGIPVFNTPGSNANAVKELVLCSLFLASRGIIDGAAHMQMLHERGEASERIEKDKAMFGGNEIAGKTLGIIGLGNIGAAVVSYHLWSDSLGHNRIWIYCANKTREICLTRSFFSSVRQNLHPNLE